MMSKEEFNRFLKETGGLVHPEGGLHSITLFGVECDDGWLELIAELIRELINAGWTREVQQIKEKFGGLCFYAIGLPENGYEIISRYEKRSYEICERCGSTDDVSLCEDNWLKTLCGRCAGPWLARFSRFDLNS